MYSVQVIKYLWLVLQLLERLLCVQRSASDLVGAVGGILNRQTHKQIFAEDVGPGLPNVLWRCTDIAGKLKHLLMDLEIK